MNHSREMTRRQFLQCVVGGATVAGISTAVGSLEAFSHVGKTHPSLPTRPLGKTRRAVGLFSLGGQATLEIDNRDDEAAAIIHKALDEGVNYIDTAAAYGGGVSEQYIGQVMQTRRGEVFLASKTHSRSYDGSMRLLERSLKSLQTDHLDLWQLHNVRTEDDLEKIFASDGAIKALEKARDEKTVRFLGITGHRDPFVLKKAITSYPFDTILMALNAADRHQASFIDHLLPVAVEKEMGIIGMKIPARGRIFREGGITTMEQAMRYVLTLPVSTVIVGITKLDELEENVRIARTFHPYSREEMAKTEALTKPYFADASWFKERW